MTYGATRWRRDGCVDEHNAPDGPPVCHELRVAGGVFSKSGKHCSCATESRKATWTKKAHPDLFFVQEELRLRLVLAAQLSAYQNRPGRSLDCS
jgi:hypothetical protein